jgi:hypothetical protein
MEPGGRYGLFASGSVTRTGAITNSISSAPIMATSNTRAANNQAESGRIVGLRLRTRSAGKTFAELKKEFALEAVPTNHYAANGAW